jgi:hypothetical protein
MEAALKKKGSSKSQGSLAAAAEEVRPDYGYQQQRQQRQQQWWLSCSVWDFTLCLLCQYHSKGCLNIPDMANLDMTPFDWLLC